MGAMLSMASWVVAEEVAQKDAPTWVVVVVVAYLAGIILSLYMLRRNEMVGDWRSEWIDDFYSAQRYRILRNMPQRGDEVVREAVATYDEMMWSWLPWRDSSWVKDPLCYVNVLTDAELWRSERLHIESKYKATEWFADAIDVTGWTEDDFRDLLN